MRSTSFVETFVTKVVLEFFWMISSFLMLANPQATFAMFSLCYAQHSGYFLCIMFPSPNIL